MVNPKVFKRLAEFDEASKEEFFKQLNITSEFEITLKDLHRLMRSNDVNTKVKELVCLLIMANRSKRSISILIKTLNDENSALSHLAMLSLAVIKSNKALESMIDILRGSPNHEKRRQATYILQGYFNSERAIDALIEALNDKTQSSETRAQAAEGLGTLSATRATPYLVANLQDSSLEVRAECVWSLGQVGMDMEIIPKLEKFIGDKTKVGVFTIEQEAKEAIKFIKARNKALEKYTGDKAMVTVWDIHTETLEIVKKMEAEEKLKLNSTEN